MIGNVDLTRLQQGPTEEISASVSYCLEYGSPGWGYIYGSCNSIFEEVPLENYLYMLEIWREFGPWPLDAPAGFISEVARDTKGGKSDR